MKYSASNKPLVCMQTTSTCYKGTRKMDVKGVLWHSTGANNPWLKRYVQPSDNAPDRDEWLQRLGRNQYGNDWNHIKRDAGLNCWVGKLADGTVTTVQTMPWDFRPWGCGSGKNGSCNTGWVQFEICEDGLTDPVYFNAVYQEACEITAYICSMFGIDPHGTVKVGSVTVPTILCHWDSYLLGLGGGHSDVYPWFKNHNKTMDNVRDDVARLLGGYKPAAPSTVNYRVEVTAEDGLNCRSAPNTSGSIVVTYKKGSVLTVSKEQNGWGYTGKGWVSLAYTKKHVEEEVDMTKDEVVKLIEDTVSTSVEKALLRVPNKSGPVYGKVEQVPSSYRPTIQKLVDKKILKGVGNGQLDVSEDFCRTLTILDRMGLIK